MDGSESTCVSEDALPLPAMPILDTQLGVSATAATATEYTCEQTEHVSQTIEMQNVAEDQTLPKRPRLQTSDGESLERRSASVFDEISPPHERWAFNLLIVNLSRNITDEEFRQMKEIYKGDIPRKLLSSFKTPVDLFDMMQKTLFLTPVNLLQLEGMFWNLGRQDLMDQVIEYGRKTGNVIYFQPASLAPVNGYTHVKFHVCGKNFNEITKDELCYLRTVVANILLIPSSFVLIDGVDPSSSITVTMLIPDRHVEILQKMLNTKEIDLSELIAFGVDSLTIGESVFPIAENSKISTDMYMEQSDVEMFVKLQKSTDTVANLELENMKQMERIKEVETQNLVLQAQNETFMRSAKPNDMFPEGKIKLEKPDELDTKIQDALLKFSNTLEEMTKDNCNKQLVLQLLEAHATLIATRCFQELSMIISKLAMQTQHLTIIKGTNVALGRFVEGDVSESEPTKVLQEISQKLLPDERRILEKDYNWTEHDKEVLQKSSLPFLLLLMAKESSEKGYNSLNMTEFLRNCLTKVNRTDLLQEFLERVAKFEEDVEDVASSSTSASHVEVQPSRDTQIEEMSKNIKKILDKMNNLDDKMHLVPELGNIARQMKGEYPFRLYKQLYAESKIQ